MTNRQSRHKRRFNRGFDAGIWGDEPLEPSKSYWQGFHRGEKERAIKKCDMYKRMCVLARYLG